MGGGAAGDASIASRSGEIDRLVLLGAAPNGPADKLKSTALFMKARDDANDDWPRLPRIREQYEKAPEPKELIILDGSAHAQFLFQTDQCHEPHVAHAQLHFFRNRSDKPTRMATGRRTVRMVGLFPLRARTAVQIPSWNGSETSSRRSPYIFMLLEVAKPRSRILEQFSAGDRPLALRIVGGSGRTSFIGTSSLGGIK